MKIVRASESEPDIVVDLKMEMFREVGSVNLLKDGAEEEIRETYAALYGEDKLCHFIAYDDNGMAAACGGAVIKDDVPFCFFKSPCYGYVMDVYCIPSQRRRGIATEVMKCVLKWLEDKDIKCIKLKPSESGRGVYEKLGFYDSGEMEKWI